MLLKNILLLTVSIIVLSSCGSMKVPLEKISPENDIFQLSWIKNLDPVYNTGNLPIGTSSPYIFEDILYMGDLQGNIKAYDIETGKVVWMHQEGYPIQSQVNKIGDYVYYGTKSGRLFSRHYLTGKLNYATDLGAPIETQPSFVSGRVVIHLRNHTIITLDAKTGKVFWRYKRSIPYITTLQRVSKVLPYKNNIIIGFADGYIASLSLEEGVLNWEQKISTGVKFVDVDVQPILFEGLVIAGSAAGPMRMINPDNGVIEKTIEVIQSHTPLVLNEELFVGSVFGVVYHIDKYGKIINKNKISDDGISSINLWKKGLAVTTMGSSITQIDKNSLAIISTFQLGHEQSAIFGSSINSGENLSVYSSRNRLYIFR